MRWVSRYLLAAMLFAAWQCGVPTQAVHAEAASYFAPAMLIAGAQLDTAPAHQVLPADREFLPAALEEDSSLEFVDDTQHSDWLAACEGNRLLILSAFELAGCQTPVAHPTNPSLIDQHVRLQN